MHGLYHSYYFCRGISYPITAPSVAPVGLSIISQSSNSLTLHWSPPPAEGQNGLINGYSINVTSSATGEVVLLNSTEDFISVASLSPYTTYLCSVAAQTVIGLGPYTSPLAVTTDEEGNACN